ncbi:MAG: alpha/beta hydrolase [Nocardioides sp.]|nr:alpha/beta hydrolase [Nocardioides sp.]
MAIVAVAALVVMTIGGAVWQIVAGGGGDDSPGESQQQSEPKLWKGPTQKAPQPALQKFYDQDLYWEQCDENQCARIQVPLDYAEPNGKTIELELLKKPAADPDQRVGSLLVNPGGPGAPGTSYAEQASYAFSQNLRNRFDIVGFDPRGTGSSSPVDCLSDDDLDAYLAADPDPDTPAEVKTMTQWSERMGEGCASMSPDLSAHVSTVEAARDIDVIRGIIGEDKTTYFGASYGTKLGATYADLFPKKVGRLVLDGAVDVSLTSRESDLEQAAGFETALTSYVDNCVKSGDCYLGDTREAALQRIRDFLDQMDQKPLQVGDRQLTEGVALYGVLAPLYNQEYWQLLDQFLGSALKGDGSGLMQMSDLYSSRNPSGGYTDNSSEAIWAINCLDDPSYVPAAKVPAQFPAFEKASPTLGRSFAWSLTACQGLAVKAPKPRAPIEAKGAAPILVIGTTRDPATLLKWAQALARQLDSGVLVTRDGDGHTGYNQGNSCVDETVESYLVEGKTPKADVDCPA